MPLIPLRPLLEATDKYNYAHGAFNVNALVQAKAIIEVHEMFRSAAILQGADLANGYMGGCTDFKKATLQDKQRGAKVIADAVSIYAKDTKIPVVLHLDHGKDFDSVKAAVDNGYTSVMIDGSHLAFNDNVELTREVVKYAHERGVTVEGELGVLAGVEDDVFSETSTYTNPMKVCEFFKKTGVDCLAISYGTMHGPVKGTNIKLRKEIAIAAKENLRHEDIFGVLVSHGSSTVPKYIVDEINRLGGDVRNANGIPIEQLQSVIPFGIGKINIDSDIRLAVTRNVREYFYYNSDKKFNSSVAEIWKVLDTNKGEVDPRVFLAPIINSLLTENCEDKDIKDILSCMKMGVKEVVGTLIAKFGSVGSMSKVEMTSLEEMAEIYKKRGI